jgi:tektin-4
MIFIFFRRLVDEVSELEETVRKLELKTDEAEDRVRDLQHTRLSLEKDLDVKRNSLLIDRDRCLKVRTMFPSTNLLCGYRNTSALNQL